MIKIKDEEEIFFLINFESILQQKQNSIAGRGYIIFKIWTKRGGV